MYRTPKTSSESNLHQTTDTETTPKSSAIYSRIKRRRSDDVRADLSDFKKEIKDMLSKNMSQQSSEITQMSNSLKSIEESFKFLSTQYEDMKKKVENMECERRKDKEHILLLENKLESLQKCQRKNYFEIRNVPKLEEETKTTLVKMVTALSSSIKVELHPNDVKDIYRSSSKGEKKPIVVELSSYIKKTNILSAAKRYNIQNKSSKLNTSHMSLKCSNTPIFVSDHLTPLGNRLHYLAREMSKALKYKYCWTSLGDVLVRKDDNSPIIKIVNESQIQTMYNNAK